MIIIAGLGNPGAKYADNRHNIGFMAVDAIHRRYNFSGWSKKFKGEISEGEIAGEKILLVKPATFMNLSGESVGEAMRFYKVAVGDMIAIHDELDLAEGRARLKIGGGHGGHNGLKSLDAHCGRDYRRLRLGIGHPGSKERVNGHVLGDFAKADREWLEPLLDAIADNAELLVKAQDSQFLNKLALATGAPADEPARKPPKAPKAPKAPGPAGQSHIRQARNQAPPKLPATGPMAEMLKRMFAKKD